MDRETVFRNPLFRKTTQSSWLNTGGFVRILRDSRVGLPITIISRILTAGSDRLRIAAVAAGEISWSLLLGMREGGLGGNRGSEAMYRYTMAVLLSGAIGIIVSGCSSTTPVMRGQSPQASWSAGPVMGDGCPMCQSSIGPGGQVMHAQNCDSCPPSQRCHNGHCNGNCNLPFHPVHRNFHTYSVPGGLSYPPENAAPAVYQYPYYTLRGPTDFFMK